MSARRKVLGLGRLTGSFALSRALTGAGLRILCYHGISLADEHEFQPKLFMREDTFRRRLEYLRNNAYPVLGLGEALALLEARRLPPRAVVITFDDGWIGTATKAAPALQEFGFPSTLYVTTRDVLDQVPVFDVALRYLLWKGRRCELDLPSLGLGSSRFALDTPERRELVAGLVVEAASGRDPASRHDLLKQIAQRLQVNWEEFEQASLFRLIDRGALAELPARGMDLQLHTHNHLLPQNDAAGAALEIEQNRAVLRPAVRAPLVHFCYPSGEYHAHQFAWLREMRIESASTCMSGFNYPETERMELRRFLDGENISQVEFEAELSGILEWGRKARGALGRRSRAVEAR